MAYDKKLSTGAAVCKNTKNIDMVGENTKTLEMVGENTIAEVSVGENTKERSPLLPIRHERDFFVCDVFDAALKGDSASMEHPIFSLSKKPDMKTRRYENGRAGQRCGPARRGSRRSLTGTF
jgi:hypothetical protein